MISNIPDALLKCSSPVRMLIHPMTCIVDPASFMHKTPLTFKKRGINLSVHNTNALTYEIINIIDNSTLQLEFYYHNYYQKSIHRRDHLSYLSARF